MTTPPVKPPIDAAELAEIEAKAEKAAGVSTPRISVAGQDRLRFEILTGDIPRMAEEIRRAWAEIARHGPQKRRCLCPGCMVQVPACWVSGLCAACATEECTEDCDGAETF